MAELIDIEARDFCNYAEFKLKLRKRGLVWVGGVNKDSDGASSNGSGKSNLFKAIWWAAFGESVDGESGDAVIRDGAKSAATRLRFTDDDGSVWTVERERRRGAPKLRLLRDGKAVPGKRAELQERIDALLGVDWHTARCTSLYAQRDRSRFADPNTPDSERKRILHGIIRTAVYGLAHDWVKRLNLDLKRELDESEAKAEKIRAQIAEHDLEGLEASRDKFESERRERVKELGDEAASLAAAAKRLRKGAPDVVGLKRRLVKLREQQKAAETARKQERELNKALEPASEALHAARRRATEARRALEAAERELSRLAGERCPTCTAPLSKGEAARHVAGLKAAAEAARLKVEATKPAVLDAERAHESACDAAQAAHDRAEALEVDPDAITKAADELSAARTVRERIRSMTERARDRLQAAKRLRSESNPLDAKITEAKARIRELESALDETKERQESLALERAHVEFWARGFGPHGLPSFVLDATMPVLTERANHYLGVLADGDIVVQFSTQRELRSAKGEFRDEIAINWEIEGVAGYPPSGGQWKKIELATDFALMDLVSSREGGARLNVMCLDEALDGLDPEGRSRILQLLYELRRAHSSIFVVSHESEMAEIFERGITVVKEGGIARLEAA